jgi:hypothetical protein
MALDMSILQKLNAIFAVTAATGFHNQRAGMGFEPKTNGDVTRKIPFFIKINLSNVFIRVKICCVQRGTSLLFEIQYSPRFFVLYESC